MGYGGLQYNRGDFYQYQDGEGKLIHSALQLFIPWNALDGDGDGRQEIMAVDAQRVRLLEATAPGRFPERLIWEQRQVWGGEVGDLDGDGRTEFFLRSSQGAFFQVFESTGDDRFGETAVLPNPGQGTNEPGQRQVVGDLDGDGRGELLSGDDDGDLFAYESIADNAYRLTWQEEGQGDGRAVGGGADLDGDGRVEFVVARLFEDPFDVEGRRWSATVYEAAGNNAFVPEWEVQVLGGKAGGNGVALGDLDGDGSLEWALVLVPDLYVFQAVGVNAYAPVWHALASDTHRPLIGDLDGDGDLELAFNTSGRVEAVFRLGEEGQLEAPAGFRAFPLDEGSVALEWERVSGAALYRVYRDGEVLTEVGQGTGYVDGGLDSGRAYRYAVAALGNEGEGLLSEERLVQPAAAPRVRGVERLSRFQVGVLFSAPMEEVFGRAYLFRVEPGMGSPSSALADRGGRRMVLGFEEALPDSGSLTLHLGGLRSQKGTPLADREVVFWLRPLRQAARILEARALSAQEVVLRFSKGVRLPEEGLEVFSFAQEGWRIERVRVEGAEVVLELAGDTPLLPLGRSYGLRVRGLEDEDGLKVEGVVLFSYAAADLSRVRPFPNPFRPSQGPLTFGFLTPEARVYVYDLAGNLVRVLEESDGDGGVEWDGRNAAGKEVESGVYLFRAINGQEAAAGKFALVRP
jgi:hypothetical protein